MSVCGVITFILEYADSYTMKRDTVRKDIYPDRLPQYSCFLACNPAIKLQFLVELCKSRQICSFGV